MFFSTIRTVRPDGARPPEINSGLLFSGPGSGSMTTLADAWAELAAGLHDAAAAYRRTTAGPQPYLATFDELLAPATPSLSRLSSLAATTDFALRHLNCLNKEAALRRAAALRLRGTRFGGADGAAAVDDRSRRGRRHHRRALLPGPTGPCRQTAEAGRWRDDRDPAQLRSLVSSRASSPACPGGQRGVTSAGLTRFHQEGRRGDGPGLFTCQKGCGEESHGHGHQPAIGTAQLPNNDRNGVAGRWNRVPQRLTAPRHCTVTDLRNGQPVEPPYAATSRQPHLTPVRSRIVPGVRLAGDGSRRCPSSCGPRPGNWWRRHRN